MVKSYGMSFDEVLYGMTYTNIQMYSAVLPTYDRPADDKDKKINASDPKNKAEVHKILFG
jgi:hypothetical protein